MTSVLVCTLVLSYKSAVFKVIGFLTLFLQAAIARDDLVRVASPGPEIEIKCPFLLALEAFKKNKYFSGIRGDFQSIIEYPYEDWLRLLAADRVEEAGFEHSAVRAYFIRNQVQLSRALGWGGSRAIENLPLSVGDYARTLNLTIHPVLFKMKKNLESTHYDSCKSLCCLPSKRTPKTF